MNEFHQPEYTCSLCPRLAAFHDSNRKAYPGFYNGPVPSFGELDAELLVIGLAPGLKGANRTGRPFTGDYAGIVLYSALQKNGFAAGNYDPEKVISGRWPMTRSLRGYAEEAKPTTPLEGVSVSEGGDTSPPYNKTDGFRLINCRITNAVRCVPPENKPEPSEIKQCNTFLQHEIKAMGRLKVIVTLGQIAHKAVIQALGFKQSQYKFGHGAIHNLQPATRNPQLLNSYHSSRYNINTGALTQDMFDEVIKTAKEIIAE